MDDDEINELLARDDKEIDVFKDMDVKRMRDAKHNWQLAGRHGPPPQPLMQLEELPECYRNDDFFDVAPLEEEMEGRGHRRRNAVNYNDGLSDDAWARALEDDEDIDDVIAKARDRNQRRAANKLLRESEGQSSRNSPAVEEPKRKKKGRPPKNPVEEYEPISNGKRKRGGKAPSVTPSIAGDDDEARDSVCVVYSACVRVPFSDLSSLETS